jgi:Icc-related predicted phosphoesterase
MKTMKIAIFADIHGKILLPFKIVDYYQKETGNKIDYIVQCGDIGAFPDMNNLDKATLRHAKYDRDELGFHDDFTKEKPEIRSFLDELNIDMICVRGNHEDHDYLDNLEKQYADVTIFPIDIYKRVYVCKSGYIQYFEKDGIKLTWAGIGRIGDRKGRENKQFIQDYERTQVRKLFKTKENIELLITHDKDDLSSRGYGMEEISEALEHLIPNYHFYGHTGEDYKEEFADNGLTKSIKIKELEFSDTGILGNGSMVILEKNEKEELILEVVSNKILYQFTKSNWHFW